MCMWLRQRKLCGLCWEPMTLEESTFDHSDLRGMGSSRRDDRIVFPDGTLTNVAAHRICNGLRGSRRGVFHSGVHSGNSK
jgi:hypothetical protein